MNTKRRSIIFFVNRAYFFRVGILFCCSIHFWCLFLFKDDRLSIDCVCFGYVVVLILSSSILIARERGQHILLADRRKSLYVFSSFFSTNFHWIKRHLWFFAVLLKTLQLNNLWMIKFSQAPNLSEILPVEKKSLLFSANSVFFQLEQFLSSFEFHLRLNNKCMLTSFFNEPTDSKPFD